MTRRLVSLFFVLIIFMVLQIYLGRALANLMYCVFEILFYKAHYEKIPVGPKKAQQASNYKVRKVFLLFKFFCQSQNICIKKISLFVKEHVIFLI